MTICNLNSVPWRDLSDTRISCQCERVGAVSKSIYELFSDTVLGDLKAPRTLLLELLDGAKRVSGGMYSRVWIYNQQDLLPFDPQLNRLGSDGPSKAGYNLVRRLFETGLPVSGDDIGHHLSGTCLFESEKGTEILSVLGVPLYIGQTRLGALVVADPRKNAFGVREMGLLQMLSGLFGLAVHHCTFFPQFLPYWASCIGMKAAFHRGAATASFPWSDVGGHLPKGISSLTLRLLCERLAEAI